MREKEKDIEQAQQLRIPLVIGSKKSLALILRQLLVELGRRRS